MNHLEVIWRNVSAAVRSSLQRSSLHRNREKVEVVKQCR